VARDDLFDVAGPREPGGALPRPTVMRRLLLILTGCAVVAALVIFLISRRDRPPPQPRFGERASQVLTAWRHAATDDDLNHDYYGQRPRLLDAPLLRRPGVVPDDTAGIMVRIDIALPKGNLLGDRPPDGVVRLSDGTALRVPVMRATDAEEAINEYAHEACDNYKPKSCVTLRVTGVRLDTAVLRGNHGPVTVPVWRFSTAETPDALAWVAVGIDSDLPVLRPQPKPDVPPWPPGGWWYAQVSRVAISSADTTAAGAASGTTATHLTATVPLATCGGPPPVTPVVYEAADAVVLAALGPPARRDTCGDPPMWTTAVSFPIRLGAALGNRVLLDGATGNPVPLEVSG
jgi:hypothetical protein